MAFQERSVSDERVSNIRAFLKDARGFSTLQAALGFAAIAVVAGMFIPELYSRKDAKLASFQTAAGIDRTVTGTIADSKPKRVRRYTVRRSIWQKDPSKPCIIYDDGSREGGC
ncbi:MAG: hypothetical protein AAGM04_13480 [Pseudomonadota bacterium]